MSNYSYKRGEAVEYELIPEGDYECIIDNANLATTPSGKEKISIKFKIRGDVEQNCVNRTVFDDIWRLKENPNKFNEKRMFSILDNCTGLPDEIEFEDIQEYLDLIVGQFIGCHIYIADNNWDGKETKYNAIKYFKKTKHPAQTLGSSETPIAVKADDEDNLPF